MSSDEQHLTESGTWVRPAGARRVTVTLRGGDGGPARPGGMGGTGGWPSGSIVLGMSAGGGGGAGASTHPLKGAKGGEGGTAVRTFEAADLPDHVAITIGQPGGYAHIVTELDDEQAGRP